MQCASCQFENMPGVDACGRCGSMLHIRTAVLDVNPPRATPLQKRLRRLFPHWRATAGVREAAYAAHRRAEPLAHAFGLTIPPRALLRRFPVPGLPYFYLNDVRVGRLVVGAYSSLLLLGLVFFGTYFGSILLGTAICVHAGSVAALVMRGNTPVPARLLTGLVVLIGIGLGVYGPAAWLLTRVALPVAIENAREPLHSGDVLLTNQLAYRLGKPQQGDVVLFHVDRFNLPAIGGRYPAPGVFPGGDLIDRILAGPESTVDWKNGALHINQVPSDVRPLNPASLPNAFSIRVPAGHYFIFPSTMPYINPAIAPERWSSVWLVPESEIRGTVYLRTQPLYRFGRLR